MPFQTVERQQEHREDYQGTAASTIQETAAKRQEQMGNLGLTTWNSTQILL